MIEIIGFSEKRRLDPHQSRLGFGLFGNFGEFFAFYSIQVHGPLLFLPLEVVMARAPRTTRCERISALQGHCKVNGDLFQFQVSNDSIPTVVGIRLDWPPFSFVRCGV